MGARGPKPTPTRVLESRGSWLAKTRGDSEGPLFPLGEPECPDVLTGEAEIEWRRVVEYLLAAGLLSDANRAALTAYCVCWARFVEAEKAIKDEGAVLTPENGRRYANPWVVIANEARANLVRLASEFGMTPASAGRVTPAKQEEEENAGDKSKSRFFGSVG